jgi:hypothetical protein
MEIEKLEITNGNREIVDLKIANSFSSLESRYGKNAKGFYFSDFLFLFFTKLNKKLSDGCCLFGKKIFFLQINIDYSLS